MPENKIQRETASMFLLAEQKNWMKTVEKGLIRNRSEDPTSASQDPYFCLHLRLYHLEYGINWADAVLAGRRRNDGSIWSDGTIQQNLPFFKLVKAETRMARQKLDYQRSRGNYQYGGVEEHLRKELEKFAVLEKPEPDPNDTSTDRYLVLFKKPWYRVVACYIGKGFNQIPLIREPVNK